MTRSWARMSLAQAQALLCAEGAQFEVQDVDIRGVRTRSWKNAAPDLRAVLVSSRRFGADDFLVYERERVSFEGFYRAVAAAAERLRRSGVEPGDRVAIAMSNRPEWCVAFLATTVLGAIATPLNGWWTGPELAHALRDSGARQLVADAARLGRLEPHLTDVPDLLRVLSVDTEQDTELDTELDTEQGWIGGPGSWSALPDATLPDVHIDPETPAAIFYTSGTTGTPRGAVLTHRNAVATIVAAGYSGARLALRGGVLPPPTGRRGTLLAVPLFHVTGCLSRFLPALSAGLKLVMTPRWDAAAAVGLIRSEELTATGGVPTIALQLLQQLEQDGGRLPTLLSLSWGGAPVSPEIVERMAVVLPGVVPGTGFGMTETSSMVTHHQGEEYAEAPDSCGPAVPACEIRVVGADGEQCGQGEVGELTCRGSNVFAGYWQRPAETAAVLRDGWLSTGDLARLDEEGRCFLVDRIKDVVIRGGENIYCIEVENALTSIDGVLDASVLGAPHPTLGEVPVAVLQTAEPDLDEQAVRLALAPLLAPYKIPAHLYQQAEDLPRNASGKVVKAELRRRYLSP